MPIAIVDAYDDPTVQRDVKNYRSKYGLAACASCLKVVNQSGAASPLPGTNAGWVVEESLDVDMVTAICPACHVILVEAKDSNDSDLEAGVTEAVKLGARVVSMSWGGAESSSNLSQTTFNSTGVQFVAAAGDSHYGVFFPATSSQVTSVGGTVLNRNSKMTRGWTESVWNIAGGLGTGSGCSKLEVKPTWQTDSACAFRTDNDVAAVASNLSVYDSSVSASAPWIDEEGTSASAPIIAALYALGGNPGHTAQQLYAHMSALYDITRGSNGTCGTGASTYLCTAEKGYDGPTGVGTPHGGSAFKQGTSTVGAKSNVLIYGDNNGATGTGGMQNIQAVLTKSGYKVTALSGTTALPSNFGTYGQIWHYGLDTISISDQAGLESFVQKGGSVFLSGARYDFAPAEDSADIDILAALLDTSFGVGDWDAGLFSVNSALIDGLATKPNQLTDIHMEDAGTLSGNIPVANQMTLNVNVGGAWGVGSSGGRVLAFIDTDWAEATVATMSPATENFGYFLGN